MSEEKTVQIGRYKVLSQIGHGGFGRVYLAYDASVGRQVAVKVLTAGGKDVFARFRNEAQVAGNLRHENIVTVYEYGEYQGQPFLAMEYLEGEDLQHILSSGKQLTLLEKCDIMSQVAEGLSCAHRSGVVHRDVKPANIMVRPDGRVKIMDFGIARLTQDRDATRLTQEGWVVGTLLYMAPEQFSGGEVDVLCDIFAYGAVYYELLTGRHPFQAPDSRTLMYKISFEDPPPIRDFVPDCPEVLERVILKILHKDRELRYQSLKDVQFDTEIVRMDLQRQRADELTVLAQLQADTDQVDTAQTLVAEALGLDPSNRPARILRESLQKRIQQRNLRPRIESMISAAEERLATRRFPEAVQSFEAALKLDSENAAVQQRLAYAREMLDHFREAQNLVGEAQKELGRQNLSLAYQNASEALRLDRENPTAAELLAKIQVEIENRQREKRIEEALRKSEDLILLRSYDEAITLLAGMGRDSQSPKVEQLLAWLRKEKADKERTERLQVQMKEITTLLGARNLTGAVERLEALRKDYPDEQEPVRLLAYARKELEIEARARAVKELAAKAGALADKKDFNGALSLLEDALQKYPGETTLIRMLGSTLAAKTAWERQQAVAATIRQCNELRQQQRLAEAIELVEAALRDNSADPQLVSLLEQLEQEWAGKRRAEAVRKAADAAVQALDRKQPLEAQQVLRTALIQYAGENRLLELLKRAEDEQRAIEKARAVEAIVREASARAGAQDFRRALAAIDQGLQAWPGEATLLALREETASSEAAATRRREIENCSQRATAMVGALQFDEALNLVAEALRKFPGEGALSQLRDRVAAEKEQHKRREAVRGIASEARLLISRGLLDEASELLADGATRHPGEADLESLAAQVQDAVRAREHARAIGDLIRESETLAAGQRFDDARKVLEKGLKTYPGDQGLQRQLESLKAAREKWEREQAIARAVAEAARLSGEQRFDSALELLSRVPNAPEVVEARKRLEQARDEHRAREAVAKGAAEATALLESGRPDTALKLLEQLSTRFPGEPRWPQLMDQARQGVVRRKAAEERDRAVEETTRECDKLVRLDQFEQALGRVGTALRQYSGDPALTDLQERVRLAWEERKRAEGIERAATDAGAMVAAGKLAEAVQFLRQCAAQYPGEVSLRTLLAKTEKDLADREERDRNLAECRALAAQHRYEEASQQLDRALARFPGDGELMPLAAAVRSELDRRKREESVTALAEQAAAVSKAGDFDRALRLVERGLANFPGEQRLLDLQKTIGAEQAAWKREQSRRQAMQDVHQLARKERFREAREKADAALKTFPGDAELTRLRSDCRMREILADAATASAQGKPQDGLRSMEQSAGEYGALPEWRALKERLTQEAAALERGAIVRKTTSEVRTLAGRKDFEGALARIDSALQQTPGETSLEDERRTVLASREVHKKQLAIEAAVQECTRLSEKGKIAEAIERANRALREFPDEPSLLDLLRRFREKMQAEELRKQRQADLEQLRELEPLIAQAQDSQRLNELRTACRRVQAVYTADEEIAAAASAVDGHLADIENGRAALAKSDFPATLDLCGKYLARFPQHAAFTALRQDALQGQRAAELAEIRRRADAESDLRARAGILAEAQKRYPDEGWVAEELKSTRAKQGTVEAIVAEARKQEAAGAWDLALEQWKKLSAVYDRYPGLNREMERVRAARERAAAEAIARWGAQIESQISGGQTAKARELLKQALTEFPDTKSLQELNRRLDEVEQRQKRVRDLVASLRDLRKAGKPDQLQANAKEALELSAGDAAARKSVLDKLIECAQDAVQSDWKKADAWIEQVRAADAGYPVPKPLLKSVTDARRAAAIDAALAKAEELRRAKNLRGAVAHLAEALREFPDEKRLKSAHAAADGELQKERAATTRVLNEIRQAGERAAQVADLVPLESRAASIANETAQDAELSALAAETARALAARRKQLGRARLLGVITSNGKWIAVAGGAAAVLAAGILVLPKLLSPARPVTVTITSDTAGVAVSTGSEQCTTPQCTLNLKPGSYTLTASKDGFAPVSQPLVVASTDHDVKVPLTFQPLPENLQIDTNFESGSVILDGRAAGALRDGQFTVSGVAPGQHTIRVTGRDAEFDAEWQSTPGAPPALLKPISAKNLQAAIVSNAGHTGTVACNCGSGDISVDGKAAGKTGDGISAKLPELQTGSRQIAVGGRSVVVDIRPNPAMNVFLALDRNVGTLIVDTGEDNVKVYLNNRLYPRQTEHGMLRIPVNVGDYSIRVEKDGMRSPAAQTATVAKGEEKQVAFAFTPTQPVLDIAGAQPHAHVDVDRRPVGETDASGGFRSEVAAGRHSVGLTKDGYAPVRFDMQFTQGRGPVRPSPSQIAMSKLPTTQAPPQLPPVTTTVDTEPQDWARVNNSGRLADLQDYIRKHPSGAHERDAQAQIDQLQQQAQQQSQQAEAARSDQAAWDAVDKTNKAALQDFLSRHGNSAHAQDARNLIDGIQRREDAASAEQKRSDQEKFNRAAADATAILRTISDFETAYNGMDGAAMQRLYDNMPAILRNQFRNLKSVSYQLKPLEAPAVSGNSATVMCTRAVSMVAKNNDRQNPKPERVRVTLSRTTSGWVIREITAM